MALWSKWFKRKPEHKPERPCQCGHMRCYHNHGSMSCNVIDQFYGEHRQFTVCDCAHYVPADKLTEIEQVEALERMMK